MAGGEADELYTLKNLFYLGNFQEALAEAETLTKVKNDVVKLEKDATVFRALIGLGQQRQVVSAVRDDAAVGLRAVKLFAKYTAAAAGSSERESVVARADELVEEAEREAVKGTTAVAAVSAALAQCMCATIFLNQGIADRALRAVRAGSSLEQLALTVQAHLRIDRLDLAEATLKTLQEKDDESALYQLSAAAVYAAQGGRRARESAQLYREVLDRYGAEGAAAAPALNGLAAAHIAAQRYDEAEKALGEAVSAAPEDADTLANTITLASLKGGQGEVAVAAGRALEKLRAAAPAHPYLAARSLAQGQFDRVAATFAASTAAH